MQVSIEKSGNSIKDEVATKLEDSILFKRMTVKENLKK
jgi:hypothetical protein